MDEGFVDDLGYPIGPLYFIIPYEAEARSIDYRSRNFEDNRLLYIDAGVPPTRIMTVSPRFQTIRKSESLGYPTDYDMGENLPPSLID